MEENKNYGFKFNPDKQEKSFTDKNGTSKLEIDENNYSNMYMLFLICLKELL